MVRAPSSPAVRARDSFVARIGTDAEGRRQRLCQMTVSTVRSEVPVFVRYLDVVMIVAFLPFALLAGLPVLGYVVGGLAWTVQRVLGAYLEAKAVSESDMRRSAGIQLAGVMGRAWLMGITILAVGLLGEREDGLMAAVLVFAAFTVYLALSLILRPQRKSSS